MWRCLLAILSLVTVAGQWDRTPIAQAVTSLRLDPVRLRAATSQVTLPLDLFGVCSGLSVYASRLLPAPDVYEPSLYSPFEAYSFAPSDFLLPRLSSVVLRTSIVESSLLVGDQLFLITVDEETFRDPRSIQRSLHVYSLHQEELSWRARVELSSTGLTFAGPIKMVHLHGEVFLTDGSLLMKYFPPNLYSPSPSISVLVQLASRDRADEDSLVSFTAADLLLAIATSSWMYLVQVSRGSVEQVSQFAAPSPILDTFLVEDRLFILSEYRMTAFELPDLEPGRPEHGLHNEEDLKQSSQPPIHRASLGDVESVQETTLESRRCFFGDSAEDILYLICGERAQAYVAEIVLGRDASEDGSAWRLNLNRYYLELRDVKVVRMVAGRRVLVLAGDEEIAVTYGGINREAWAGMAGQVLARKARLAELEAVHVSQGGAGSDALYLVGVAAKEVVVIGVEETSASLKISLGKVLAEAVVQDSSESSASLGETELARQSWRSVGRDSAAGRRGISEPSQERNAQTEAENKARPKAEAESCSELEGLEVPSRRRSLAEVNVATATSREGGEDSGRVWILVVGNVSTCEGVSAMHGLCTLYYPIHLQQILSSSTAQETPLASLWVVMGLLLGALALAGCYYCVQKSKLERRLARHSLLTAHELGGNPVRSNGDETQERKSGPGLNETTRNCTRQAGEEQAEDVGKESISSEQALEETSGKSIGSGIREFEGGKSGMAVVEMAVIEMASIVH